MNTLQINKIYKKNILKTLKLLAILCFIVFASCNNDDDASNPQPEQVYFPVQISILNASGSSTSTTNIEYDENNMISQFSFVKGSITSSYEVSRNQDGKITSILFTRNDGVTANYSFTYTNNRVSMITRETTANVISFNVAYDEFAHTYKIIYFPNENSKYMYDASNNIIDFQYSDFTNVTISYNSNQGVFKNISDSFPIVSATSLFDVNPLELFDSLLFSTKQITSMKGFNAITTRNEQGEIETVEFINPATLELQSTATMTYELRTIN